MEKHFSSKSIRIKNIQKYAVSESVKIMARPWLELG